MQKQEEDGISMIAVIRNPYERLVSGYLASFGYESFEEYLNEGLHRAQAYELNGIPYIKLENWETEVAEKDIDISEYSPDISKLDYASDYRCWYDKKLKKKVKTLTRADRITYNYTF
ncbi:MAG: hypothetical protein EBY39_06600 [Flavobacteriia bacterium]|nr:hypothetical protein [Flavobacteriia bacterium]